MDPYTTQAEIEANQSAFGTCPCCDKSGIPVEDIAEYKGKPMCDECYVIIKQEELGEQQLIVEREEHAGWMCTREDYDGPGDIVGMGRTIQLAIEDWLEELASRHGLNAKHIQYKWSGRELFNLNSKDFQALALETECFLRKAGVSTLFVWFKQKATAAIVTIDFVKDIDAAIKAFTAKHPEFRHDRSQGTAIYFSKTQTAA